MCVGGGGGCVKCRLDWKFSQRNESACIFDMILEQRSVYRTYHHLLLFYPPVDSVVSSVRGNQERRGCAGWPLYLLNVTVCFY